MMIERIEINLADNLHISVSDDDLISKVTDTENNFIERKTVSDTRGWLETAVAFANSCPVGYPAVLFIGVDNSGLIQQHKEPPNFEKLQKSISARIDEAWPPIYHYSKTLRKNGAEFVAVVIPGSAQRPHFSGKAFVRVGPQTRHALEDEYDKLIAQRSSKVRAIQKLIGTVVSWHSLEAAPLGGHGDGTLIDCNQFFLTFRIANSTTDRCFPIDWTTISFDSHNRRYQLIFRG
jgi:hypothetical protein